MMTPLNTRVSPAFRRYADINRADAQPWIERLLRFIGGDLTFAEDVLGDLMEERARRFERDGARSANWWYVYEALRSTPHVAWHTAKRGGTRGRARVAIVVAGMATALTIAVVAIGGEPAPVRLEVDGQRTAHAADGVIVNSRHPVVLAMRAFDATGHALNATDVQYQWMSGTPISVATNGVVTCSHPGDALVRASLGQAIATVRIKCRPVRQVLANMWMQFTAGDSSQELNFVALDPDGLPVNRLAGVLRVRDSSIATLKNGRVKPISPGRTAVVMHFGEGEATTQVSVYERVPSFIGLRADQRFAIAPVRLGPADTIRWPLPQGLFWLQFHRPSRYADIPTIAMEGPIMCTPNADQSVDRLYCLVRGSGASVRMTHPSTSPPPEVSCVECRSRHGGPIHWAQYVEGALSIEREKYP